jgi:hypothetical protein
MIGSSPTFELSIQWTATNDAAFQATSDGRSLAKPGEPMPLTRSGQVT